MTAIDTVRGRLVVGLPPDGAPFGAMMAGPEAALTFALEKGWLTIALALMSAGLSLLWFNRIL